MSDLVSLININSPNVRNSSLIGNHFEKSQVVDSLIYNDDMKLQKTGKEIKSQIESVKSSIEAEKNIHYQNMAMYKKQIGMEPEGNFDVYDARGLKDRVGEVKQYNYNQIYQKDSNSDVYNQNSNNTSITPEQKEAMEHYNHCARKYIECSVDIIVLNTLSKNLSDSKKISLNLKQAALLGF